jgi:hypothetical protein
VSTVFGSRRVAPVAAVALGALTLGLGLATVPLDILTDAVGEGLRRGLLSALESGARGLGDRPSKLGLLAVATGPAEGACVRPPRRRGGE